MVTITNNNQLEICKNLEKAGYLALAPQDWKNEASGLRETVQNLISEPGRIKQIQEKLKNCINLDGADNLLARIGL